MKSIGAEVLPPDTLPGVIHMHGMQYQIVINVTFWPELNEYSCLNLCVLFTLETTLKSPIMLLHLKAKKY